MKNKKKLICFILTVTLLLSTISVAYAKPGNAQAQNKQKTHQVEKQKEQQDKKQQEIKAEIAKPEVIKQDAKKLEEKKKEAAKNNNKIKEKKQSFKINGSPVIKYGKYKLPINPVVKGMGAAVAFDKNTAVLTVTKGSTIIVINFKEKSVMVNGVADTNSGIFTAKNDKKMTVLIKYIAAKLGVRTAIDKDKVTVTVPGLDLPTSVTVTPVGISTVANTINTTTLYLEASATITAGQATGGKAELYVGAKLVATDMQIDAADTKVSFSTSDGTPTNVELQAIVPTGGIVTVKLYNAEGKSVISNVLNPTLFVDYTAPVITSVSSAAFSVTGSAITINATTVNAVNDRVDVTKISLNDMILGKSYQLTNLSGTGSVGIVSSDNTITIQLGSADILGLTGFGSSTLVLNIASGPLLYDAAGNTSASFNGVAALPVTVTK